MQKTFGLEAGRQVLCREMRHTLTADSGSFVHPAHFELYADTVSMDGILCPATRHGLKQATHYGVLQKASFECTVKTMVQAAVEGTVDSCSSNTAAVIIGSEAKCGADMVTVLDDFAAIPRVEIDDEWD